MSSLEAINVGFQRDENTVCQRVRHCLHGVVSGGNSGDDDGIFDITVHGGKLDRKSGQHLLASNREDHRAGPGLNKSRESLCPPRHGREARR